MADERDLDLSQNLFFLAGALSRELSYQADEAFASVGLSSSHALLLLLIHRDPGVQPGALANKLHLKPSTITRLVQKLERRELVEKESQGRATAISCTGKGIRMAERISEQWQELLQGKQEELGERYVSVLSEMISKALDTMENS
ncbi:MarR family transcriptional regulator [Aliifodinibius salicampi]|uniref:MarR family transcriptional regulator n=1 Tax=Fodinibius salicampi TaxID=1920655 RepID=A0ABT3Q0P7_9BACT|nr:MarR family transcriptional regulator [Fodinibius salicampi]MCW9713683.1 MarR family transcriptional regulator [Fodinibius salicampi]